MINTIIKSKNQLFSLPISRSALNLKQKNTVATPFKIAMMRKLVGRRKLRPPTKLVVVRMNPLLSPHPVTLLELETVIL